LTVATIRTPVAGATGREWIVLAVTSVLMIFAQGTVFASLGIALFAMAATLGWTAAQAGGAFTLVVIGACVAALLPVLLMPRIGARWTLALGAAVLAVAFLVASTTRDLTTLYVAMALAGAGFSLSANTPGIYLIAGWSGARAPKMIGLYLMLGMFGNAIGPPLAQAMCAAAGGWRFYWQAMAVAAAILAAACALMLREPPAAALDAPASPPGPRYWRIVGSAPFLIMALGMVVTQACVVTVASVTAAHFARHGWSADYAAWMLGVQGLVGALATGASGFLTRHFPPRRMLAASLVLEAAGMVLLAVAREPMAAYGFAIAFGIGSCVVLLAVAVLLVRYFGDAGGTTALATIWTLAGGAAIGPWVAGIVADDVGSFGPALAGLGILLLPIAGATLLMRPAT
jgi:MFS family permease